MSTGRSTLPTYSMPPFLATMKLTTTQKLVLPPFFSPPMSPGEHNGDVDDSDDPYNIKEVTTSSQEAINIHEDPSLVEEINWAVAYQPITIVVTSNTQNGNHTDYGNNILTSGPHEY